MDVVRTCVRLAAGATCIILSASVAVAADVPVVLKAPAAPAVYNWTGVYLGGHVGYGTGMKDWTNSIFDFDVKGFLGGGQIGVNQQVGNWVFGIEADASWSNIKGSQTLTQGGPLIGITQNGIAATTVDWVATVTGRFGFAQDRWLVYAKIGAAWAHENHTLRVSQFAGIPGAAPAELTFAASGSDNRFGYVLGIGSEVALWGNWSFKSEYNYINLGNARTPLTGTQTTLGVATPVAFNAEIQQAIHLAKFGINYRFGPDAPPAIAPSPPAPGFNWSGPYVGAQGGYGIGRKIWTGFTPDREFDVTGWLAGATVGANAQAGAFVLGVESEWLWTGIKGDTQFLLGLGGAATQQTDLSNRLDWLSTASMRFGFVAADRWLVYLKGGVALAKEQHTFDALQAAPGIGSARLNLSGSALHTGYLAGIGAEHAFAGNWSAKLEYNYIAFRSQDVITSGVQALNIPPFTIGSLNFAQRVAIREHLHLVKFGINYHFNPTPDTITARY